VTLNTGKSRKQTQSSDLQDRTLGVGNPTAQSREAGKNKGRHCRVNFVGGGAAIPTSKEFDVQHDLKQVPTGFVVMGVANPSVGGTVIDINPSRQENWSATHIHIMATLLKGSFEGATADLMVLGR